jgi:hypothetical protein
VPPCVDPRDVLFLHTAGGAKHAETIPC